MAKESMGEWKLVKVWECKGCKLLIKDGREVFDHACSPKDEESEISSLRNIIDDKNLALEERDKFVDSQKIKIDNQKEKIDIQKEKIDGLDSFAEELKGNIEDCNNTIMVKDRIIDEQKTVIDDQKKTIINQEMTIEEQKKNNNKVIEKVVYLERSSSRTDNENIEKLDVDIFQKDYRIKDEKDKGYRDEIEFEIFERGKGREKIIIKNGKVMKKPDDIIVIGERTSEGFIVKGIYRNPTIQKLN